MQLMFFYLGNEYYEIQYQVAGSETYEDIMGAFEIDGNIKSFSEWNECNIKLPIDTTKN
jgi:hypothetical protein